MGKLISIVIASFLISFPVCACADSYNLLHEFTGGVSDGSKPNGSLTVYNGALYGMTTAGGSSNVGTIYKINADGTGFSLLRTFSSDDGKGYAPYGELTLSGSTFYGMTQSGGSDYTGVVFKMNTDGSGYSVLHNFVGGASDGSQPMGTLAVSGSTLYGMTPSGGGASVLGVAYKMNTDGSGFSVLHRFAGGVNDGASPYGDLTLSGSTLYGMTYGGGDSDLGVLFKMNTSGGGYSLLHEFAGGANDGSMPYGDVILSGSILYGMTRSGGDYNYGTIYKVNTDGTGYALLHEFAAGNDDGREPYGELLLDGSVLYGLTSSGGDSSLGTLFKINTDGTGFSLLHEFAGGVIDGLFPKASLVLLDDSLYSVTMYGGDTGSGVIFQFTEGGSGGDVPEPSTLLLLLPLIGFGMRKLRRR